MILFPHAPRTQNTEHRTQNLCWIVLNEGIQNLRTTPVLGQGRETQKQRALKSSSTIKPQGPNIDPRT
ncbi:hypothetical protein PM082_024916 [Marasmius tenuissimus]|nr:hypothetical protein PM082_024916 [Marasmius tenuissimus]